LFAFLLGMVTALTQTILIRELMIETGATELVIAVALSLWMLFTGIGSLSFRFLPFLRWKWALPSLITLLALTAVGQLFLIGSLTARFSAVTGVAVTIPAMLSIAALVLLPGCLLGGLAFPACVAAARAKNNATGLIYLTESGGMALGALLFYLFLDTFSPVRYAPFFNHYAARYQPDTLILSRDGRYGRLDVTQRNEQTAYRWNGQTAGTLGESQTVEEFSGLALTQHPDPRRIAVIGGLLSGTAAEVARRMPQAAVIVIEPDPVLFTAYPTDTLGKNVTLRSGEPTSILTGLPPQELIILDLPDPSSVMLSRFFSREFFQFIREDNGPGAVLVVGLSGGRGMLPPELAALNRSVQKALQEAFQEVKLVPAGRHLFVAADNNFPTVDPAIVTERMERNNLIGDWFNDALVSDILEPMHRQLTETAVEKATTRENRLLAPSAYFETLRHTARRLDDPLPAVVSALPDRPIFFLMITGIFTFFCAVGIAFLTRRHLAPARSIALFAVSGGAFVLQLALMTLLQAFIGQIYHLIALLTVSFMLGITAGLFIYRYYSGYLFIPFALLALVAAGLIFAAPYDLSAAGYIGANFLVALLLGLSLGNLARSSDGEQSPGAAFYLADLAGAAVCGLLFGAAMLPLYDLRFSIAVAGVLALVGMFAALTMPRGAAGR
jgi:spermidine synthase